MIHWIDRDFNIPLKKQIKDGESRGWLYIGVFGRCNNSRLMFMEKG